MIVSTVLLSSIFAIQSFVLLVFLAVIVRFNAKQHDQFSSFTEILMTHVSDLHEKIVRKQTDEEIIAELKRSQ